ncbi:MAG: siderophore-interacting protein [Propionibacteriaceae bacterium]
MTAPARPKRPVRTATVVRTEKLSATLVRVVFTVDDPAGMPELSFTDHYVKILFAPEGADYTWPFDDDTIRAERPRAEWPVTRTYTIRTYDPETAELAMDFVVHGDSGLAGPWAGRAQPGDTIGFRGPGGAWAPDPAASLVWLIGDEAAIPAIAAALDVLAEDVAAEVFVEVATAAEHVELRERDNIAVHWAHRDDLGAGYGQALAAAVRATPVPHQDLHAFVHGNAEMIKDLRRYLFLESGVDRKNVSISGYWRTGQTEDMWQAGKAEFNQAMEAEEVAAAQRGD